MRYASSLHDIHEEEVYYEHHYDDTDYSSDTDTTRSISIESIDSLLPIVQRDRYQARDICTKRLVEKFSGKGLFVWKRNRRGNGRRYRRLSLMGKHVYLSSFLDTKVIAIDTVGCTKTMGKVLIMETLDHGSLHLKMPTVTDALAFIHVLGYIKGSV